MPRVCQQTARWEVRTGDSAQTAKLSKEIGVSPVLARLLINRAFFEADESRRFLQPLLTHLTPPTLIHDMEIAASRIAKAIERKEKVLVYGDYDVDGVTGTTLMLDFLRLSGLEPSYYIPCRLTEGYGFSQQFLDRLDDLDPDLILSIDNGIASRESIAVMNAKGKEVIVTDHHEPPPDLPEALALVNPKLAEDSRGLHDLCGAAVAYKTAWAVAEKLSPSRRVSEEFRSFLVDSLGLVALGTICDVVPLRWENRVLASFGLRALLHSKKPGLKALLDLACPSGEPISEEDVGFRIGPRINAAGRMGHADRAIDLLMADDYNAGMAIAKELESINRKRKETEQGILEEATRQIEEQDGGPDQPVFVLAAQGWHSGVVGIVAARIAETYHRPTVLIGLDGDRGRGSARSIHGVDLLDLIRTCSSPLIRFGGHAFAAGLEILEKDVDDFRDQMKSAASTEIGEGSDGPRVEVDLEVSLENLSLPLVDELRLLAPYGKDNPPPVFLATGVELAGAPRIVGSTSRHLSLFVRQGKTVLRAIGFNLASHYESLLERRPFSILFVPIRNSFRGQTSMELQLLDLRTD